jgi:hypothetical protein
MMVEHDWSLARQERVLVDHCESIPGAAERSSSFLLGLSHSARLQPIQRGPAIDGSP